MKITLTETACPSETGVVKFTLPDVLHNNNKTARITSVDFPYSQRTIEQSRNTINYIESIKITPSFRCIHILFEDSVETIDLPAILPLTVNKVNSIHNNKIAFEEPHGYFAPACFSRGSRNVVASYTSVFPIGTTILTLIHHRSGSMEINPSHIDYVDEHTIKYTGKKSITNGKALKTSYMLTPEIPDINALTKCITISTNASIQFTFDEATARTKMHNGSSGYNVKSISGDNLARSILGYDGVYTGFEQVKIPSSCYGYGELSITDTIQDEVNRWVLSNESAMVFRCNHGYTWAVTLPAGNYCTGHKVANCIAALMNATSKKHNPYNIRFTNDGLFVFASGLSFDLLFGDDKSTLAKFLGFEAVDHTNLTTYASDFGRSVIKIAPNRNIYMCCEVPGTHQLKLQRKTHAALDARIHSYKNGILELTTVDRMTGIKVATGLVENDIVTLTSLLPPPEGSTGETREGYMFRTRSKVVGVVIDDDNEVKAASTLRVSVPSVSFEIAIGQYITVDKQDAAFSICTFNNNKHSQLSTSVPSSLLGFNPGVCVGKYGTVISPATLNLGHGIVHAQFLEGTMTVGSTDLYTKSGNSIAMQLSAKRGGQNTLGTLNFTNSLHEFQLHFKNADGTPYEFNAAPVTLTLEF